MLIKSFKDHIRESGLLSAADYKRVLEDSMNRRNGTFYSSLQKMGILDEKTVIEEACKVFGCIQIDDPFRVPIDFDITLKITSIENIRETKQFAVTMDGETVYVIADPENDAAKNAATTVIGHIPKFALITAEQFEVFSLYQIKPKENAMTSDTVIEKAKPAGKGGGLLTGDSATDTTITTAAQKLLNSLIQCAIERRASDLHIRAMGRNMNAKVLLRVDNDIQDYTEIKANVLDNLRNLLKTECRVGGENPNAPVEGQITVKHGDEDIDVRVNIVRAKAGYDFVLRFIRSTVREIPDLGMSKYNEALYRRLLLMTQGLILICGPTGSGKTTLLYAGLIDRLREHKVVYTMEEPVEIVVPGIVQNDITKTKNDYTEERKNKYREAFSSALRADPDIMLFGEIRNEDVAEDVIQASNTGHLVLSTLHANDAASAISRLIYMGIEPYALGDTLAAVIAQRLVRRVCPDCKEEYDLPANHYWRTMFDLGDGPIRLARGCGCAKCAGTGYFDRIAINEIAVVNNEVRDAIQTKAPRSVIEAALLKNGFKSYIEDGVEKALAGITTLSELEKYQNDVVKSIRAKGDKEPDEMEVREDSLL